MAGWGSITLQMCVGPAGLLVLLPLCACSQGGLSSASIASYTASNAIIPAGYSEKQLDDTHFEVHANGTESTPRAHVEKIALARAAEIGVERRLPYFKVVNVTHGVVCVPKREVYKMGTAGAMRYPTVSLDVVYAKLPSGPDYRSAADTFAQVKGEIDSAAVTPDLTAAAVEDIRTRCGAS